MTVIPCTARFVAILTGLFLFIGQMPAGIAQTATPVQAAMTGSWFDPGQSGHGVMLEVLDDSRAWACWFTFDQAGTRTWICGLGRIDSNRIVVDAFVQQGGLFPPLFDPGQVTSLDWGTITLTFLDCNSAQMDWETGVPGYQSGSMPLTRLTVITGLRCFEAGAPTGAIDKTIVLDDIGEYRYFLYIPDSYSPASPMPVMIAWHGAAGAGNSLNAARIARDDWSTIAEDQGFAVIAQVSTGAQGGWIPDVAESILDTLLEELDGDYAIDRNRLYSWGFSAGGHVLHEIMLRRSTEFAGYGVSAGVLAAYAGLDKPASATRIIPLVINVGDQDPLLTPAASDRIIFINAGWVAGSTLWYNQFSGGHIYLTDHLQSTWMQLRDFSLLSSPRDD